MGGAELAKVHGAKRSGCPVRDAAISKVMMCRLDLVAGCIRFGCWIDGESVEDPSEETSAWKTHVHHHRSGLRRSIRRTGIREAQKTPDG